MWVNVALGLTPKQIAVVLSLTMFSNQVVASAIISLFLLRLLYPFVDKSGRTEGVLRKRLKVEAKKDTWLLLVI